MPQPSYAYACARISALEKRLFDETALRRMAESSLQDAMRLLLDSRYGFNAEASEADIEKLIGNELTEAAREVRELSPKPEMTDLFLLKNDIANLKQLIKARLVAQDGIDWQPGGIFGRELLEYCVSNSDYRQLPPELCEALNRLEKRLELSVEPQNISISLDAAYLDYAMKKAGKNPFLLHYFKAEADFDNLLTFLRMRAMGAGLEQFHDVMLPEGGIWHKDLLNAYELSFDALNRFMRESVCRDAILEGLNQMQQTGSIGEVERARDNYLLKLLKDRKHDRESIFPIIGYYIAKEREAKAIRLVITAKRNGLSEEVIFGRLVNLYG
ncbi:MAG: V-type ATPase subunit [Clostridia bacterium]|nr:V-type ATPase subunit [Clostridia bacterium]